MNSKQINLRYRETDSFQKDFKKLLKRYRSLKEDFETAKRNAIALYHEVGKDNHSIFEISGICSERLKIYKLKKFACKALKGRGAQSGIRITYAYHLDTQEIVFIEMYFKADQETEDTERLEAYVR